MPNQRSVLLSIKFASANLCVLRVSALIRIRPFPAFHFSAFRFFPPPFPRSTKPALTLTFLLWLKPLRQL